MTLLTIRYYRVGILLCDVLTETEEMKIGCIESMVLVELLQEF